MMITYQLPVELSVAEICKDVNELQPLEFATVPNPHEPLLAGVGNAEATTCISCVLVFVLYYVCKFESTGSSRFMPGLRF
jgi:hypothetical protein